MTKPQTASDFSGWTASKVAAAKRLSDHSVTHFSLPVLHPSPVLCYDKWKVRRHLMATSTPYDDVFRTLLNDCSQLILPVLNESFDEHYSGHERIVFLPSEHFLSSLPSFPLRQGIWHLRKGRRKAARLEKSLQRNHEAIGNVARFWRNRRIHKTRHHRYDQRSYKAPRRAFHKRKGRSWLISWAYY